MKKLAFIALLALGFTACNNADTKEASNSEATENKEMSKEEMAEANAPEEPEGKMINGMMSYGAEISPEDAIPGNDLMAMIESQDSLEVKVQAKINSCCQKKGCWMKMDLGEGNEMMVRFKDYGFFVPKDAAGDLAIVQGKVKKTLIPIDELKHYAEDAGKSQKEIDAITEPEERITFLADGVLIKET